MSEDTTPTAADTLRTRVTNVSTRLQHLRDLLTSERLGTYEERRTAMDAIDRESAEYVPDFSRLERRRLEVEAQMQQVSAALPSETPARNGPPPIQRSRRRVLRPTERLIRHRERLVAQNVGNGALSSPSERPPPPIEPSEVAIQEYMDEAEVNRENRWRAKRRKLDDGTFEDVEQTFSYGDKGSVVEGALRLEIVSCDGGEYSEPNGGSSRPQHALLDDASVYCTKSNHCNMLLKHVGGMPFSLTKVTIKAPDDGYDAPIQEGMIFVSLEDNSLLEQTSQYEVRYSPRSYRHHYRRLDPRGPRYWRPSHEYLHSHRYPLHSIDHSVVLRPSEFERLQNERRETERPELDQPLEPTLVPGFTVTTSYDVDNENNSNSRNVERPHWHSYVGEDLDPSRLARAHRDLGDHYRPTYSPPPPPPFGYIHRDDPDAEEGADSDDGSSASGEGAYLPRAEDYASRDYNSGSFREREWHAEVEAESRRAAISTVPWTTRTRDPQASVEASWDRTPDLAQRMSLRRETPSRIELRRPPTDDANEQQRQDQQRPETPRGTDEPSSPNTKTSPTKIDKTSDQPLAPHARFFIRRDKSCVSIKFDPPV